MDSVRRTNARFVRICASKRKIVDDRGLTGYWREI